MSGGMIAVLIAGLVVVLGYAAWFCMSLVVKMEQRPPVNFDRGPVR